MQKLSLDTDLVEMSGEAERRLRPAFATFESLRIQFRLGKQAQPSMLVGIKCFIKYSVATLLILLMISCGNWGWEAIDTDNEETLNIFGLISLDDSLSSFVIVHKTLDTAGPDEEIIGYDTLFYETWEWYNEDSGLFERDTFWYDPPYVRTLRESLYIVKDATVTISDESQSYSFVRSPKQLSDGSNDFYQDAFLSDPGIYLNTAGDFTPRPNTTYTLLITTPAGQIVQGTLQTPARPRIKQDELEDTLSINSLFNVNWHFDGEFNTTISTGKALRDWENFVCGTEQFGIMDPGDTTWTSTVDTWCLEEGSSAGNVTSLDIRLRYLDENYYRYFLSSDSEVEAISNFLIGEGSIGTSYGIEGGFGVFGAMSAEWVNRFATP